MKKHHLHRIIITVTHKMTSSAPKLKSKQTEIPNIDVLVLRRPILEHFAACVQTLGFNKISDRVDGKHLQRHSEA